jgi:hypothetical protein
MLRSEVTGKNAAFYELVTERNATAYVEVREIPSSEGQTPDMERPVNYELRFIFLSSFVLFPLGSSAGRGRGSCNDD